MPNDLPADEGGLFAAGTSFIKEITADPTAFGLTAAQVASLNGKHVAFGSAIEADDTAETNRRTTIAGKKASRRDFETEFRQLRQVVQSHPGTTDTQRATLNLATGEGSDTGRIGLDNAPVLLVETPGVHLHRIRFYLAGEDTNSTKKPDDALGCKIFLKIEGAASTDLKDYQMIALDTKSPYDYTHEAANAGKTAHYAGVWESRDGDRSPQSEIFSVVIT